MSTRRVCPTHWLALFSHESWRPLYKTGNQSQHSATAGTCTSAQCCCLKRAHLLSHCRCTPRYARLTMGRDLQIKRPVLMTLEFLPPAEQALIFEQRSFGIAGCLVTYIQQCRDNVIPWPFLQVDVITKVFHVKHLLSHLRAVKQTAAGFCMGFQSKTLVLVLKFFLSFLCLVPWLSLHTDSPMTPRCYGWAG